MAGLFSSPNAYQQEQNAALLKTANDQADWTPNQWANYGMSVGGQTAAKGLRGVLGIKDPELERLAQGREMLKNYDTTDPKSMLQAAKDFGALGMHDFGEQAFNKAKELLAAGKTKAEVEKLSAQAEAAKRGYGKINPQMYTPESLAKFKESGDFADLEINPKAVNIKAQSPAGKVAADRGFTPGTPEFAAEVRKVEEEMAKASSEKIKAKSQMPAAIVKQVDELQSHVDTFGNNIQDIDSLVKLMDENKVKFSPGDNFESFLRTVFNNSDEAARVKSDLRTTVEGMRNAILQGNKGTQTEGDAERAASEILSALDKNDTATVYRRLTVLKTKFERAMNQRKSRMDTLMGMYGQGQKAPAEEAPVPSQPAATAPTGPAGPTFSRKDNITDAASVKKAFKEGKISREQAKVMLKDLGM